MRKLIHLDNVFPTGEQAQQPVLLWGAGRQDFSRITKTAYEAVEFIKNVQPEPGKTHMLVLALGGEETYGPNRNGDGFPERPVTAKRGSGYWVPPGEELTKHYQTFETNPAHAFKHHVNKDPKLGSGYVKKAFWNPKMHRVELLIIVDNAKDPEWVQRVNDGDFPAVSMGCRIKRDVCAICGNEAPTRADYCDHARFQMNQVLPDGRKCYVHNPSPNFFDISRVFRPADRTGYTLKKVAHVYEVQSSAELGDLLDDLENKAAAIGKVSDIDKIVRGEPVASSSNVSDDEARIVRKFRDYASGHLGNVPEIAREVLAAYAPSVAFSTLAAAGIALTGTEFMRYVVPKLAGVDVIMNDRAARDIAAQQHNVFGFFSRSPAFFSKVARLDFLQEDPRLVNATLLRALLPYQNKRASITGMLSRIVPEGIGVRPLEAPTTDMLSYTDPSTHQSWRTTRGAAIQTHDAIAKQQLMKVLGGSALLYGAYRALGAHPSLRPWRVPLALGGAAAGAHLLRPRTGPQVRTDQGLDVSRYTEFAPSPPEERTAALVLGMMLDYRDNNSHGESIAYKMAGEVDPTVGLDFDFDSVAEMLGQHLGF